MPGQTYPVANRHSTTGTVTSVNSGVASVTLLAANPARVGFSIVNTDANTLYVLCSTGTASAVNHSVPIPAGSYYEDPFGYPGIVSGIWAADGAGVALCTEYV